MKVEYIIHDREDVIAIVYRDETLGRVVVIKNNINPDSTLSVISMDDNNEKNSIDMKDFILSIIPKEEE